MAQGKLDSFTKLNAWQTSHILVVRIFEVCECLLYHDPLRNQMERAALSITSNIAEGFGRQSLADKKHFYVMARGSAFELQDQLVVARDTKRLSGSEFEKLADLSLNSVRLLHGLIRSINRNVKASS